MTFDLRFLETAVHGARFPRPGGPGAISGHAAGEPFDKHVDSLIRDRYPDRTYRQFEALNAVLAANPKARTFEERRDLLGPPALSMLLVRGHQVMRDWAPDNLFDEKQDDTADVIVLASRAPDLMVPTVHLVDVKAHSLDKRGMPQNIISARKVAKMCRAMIDSRAFDSHDITYVGVDRELQEDELVAGDCAVVELFEVPPEQLYINWAAATQIQFRVGGLDQSFGEGVEAWCFAYIRHFVKSAEERITKSQKDFIDAYAAYL